jgi:hypothetical protein
MASKFLHVVTNSEVTCFRQCKAKHGFAYFDLLRPLLTPHALAWGDLYHHGADVGWTAAWSVAEMSTDARLAAALGAAPIAIAERAAEHIRTIEATTFPGDVDKNALCEETEQAAKGASWSVGHYFQQARGDLSMVPLMIEGQYQTQIPTAAGRPGKLASAGKIDLALWDRELGRIVVQDHKGTANDVHSIEKRLELDTQLVGYVCAVKAQLDRIGAGNFTQLVTELPTTAAARLVIARQWPEVHGATVGSIGYNVVRRKMPSTPSLNLLKKSQCRTPEQFELLRAQDADGEPRGEVSVAQIDTLHPYYQAALEAQIMERSLPATDKQLALLERLKAKGDTYFAQIEYFKNAEAIDRWRRELWVEAKLMRAAERDPSLRTRNPMACTLPSSPPCSYSLVCLNPGDPAALRSYRVAKSKHEELADGNSVDATEQPEEESQEVDRWR